MFVESKTIGRYNNYMTKNLYENKLDVEAFYDRIIKLYDVTFKFNRYSNSLERYLSDNLPILPKAPRILDAGCGPGLLTEALLKTSDSRSRITGIDLSAKSIHVAKKTVGEMGEFEGRVRFIQANMLNMPFPDESFDLVVTSGAIEYICLQAGLSEIARVLRPGGYLIYLPLKPSLVGYFLAISFHMKMYPPREVTESVRSHFKIVSHYSFTPWEPIGWSKTAILGRKL